MSASRDWVGMEAEISLLLPEAGAAAKRGELLARLHDYSTAAVREARARGPLTPSADECTRALEWLTLPVFICGHHRSGTTLLQSLLDGHPRLLTLPSEGTYFTSFAYVARRVPGNAALDDFAAEWIRRFIDPNFAPHFRLGKSDAQRNPSVDFARSLFGWHAQLTQRVPPRLAALFALAAAFAVTTRRDDSPLMWVEKTPQNERYVSGLALLTGARFIQLVRDPRSTLASLREAYRASGVAQFDAAEHARTIGRSLRLAVENQKRLRHRYLVVRYEDLVQRTDDEVERVRKFLGVDPDPALLSPTASGEVVAANSSFERGAAGVVEALRPRELQLREDAELLGTYGATAARAFGYAIPAPGPIARVGLRARHAPRHVLRAGRARLRAVMLPIVRRHLDTSH